MRNSSRTDDEAPRNPLFEALLPLGEVLEVTGKTPFFLDDPEICWCVLEGHLNVYVTPREGQTPTGGRDFLFSLRGGEALFGVEGGLFGDTMGLLAGGIPGTRVLRLPRSALLHRDRAAAAALVDRFLEGLGRGIAKDIVPLPPIRQRLAPGSVPLEANRAAAGERVLWAELETGRALFAGTEDLAPGGGWFAVPPPCWILPLEPCTVRSRTTEDLLEEGILEEALDRFCETLFSALAMNARLRAADDLGALRRMQRTSRRALDQGLRALAATLSGRRPPGGSPEGSPLREAFASVAGHLGLSVSLPVEEEGRETLQDLALASNLKVRLVTLGGPWWVSDGPPLLAFRDRIPGALLPTGRGGYRLRDEEGERPVTEELAGSLSPEAYQLYRPLPSRPLRARDLLPFGLIGSGKDLAFALGTAVALALLGLVPPEVNRLVFGEVIPQADRGRLGQLFAILAAAACSSGLLHLAQGVALLRAETRMDHDVSTGLWERILHLPVDFFRRFSSGDLANRALGLFLLRDTASLAVQTLLVQSIFCVFHLGQALWYDWRMGLAGLGCLLAPGVLMVAVNRRQLRFQRAMAALQNRVSSLIFQALSGIAKVRVAGAEDRVFAQWAEPFGKQRNLGTRARGLENGLNAVLALVPLMVTLVLFYVLFRWSAQDGSYDTGRFMAFWSAFGSLQTAFFQVLSSTTSALNVLPLAENLAPILEALPETGAHRTDPGEITGRIDLERVVFRYRSDGPAVLKGLTCHVEPGEFVAVVGPSGAGKSTLVRLLLGFNEPESGSVFFDSKDLTELDRGKLRRQVGVVLQGGGLLPGDILSNVRCSRNLTVDQAQEALRLAGLAEDVAAMPMGIHTVITDGANTLSGGQRQRLLIARALAGNPKVLVFDEATSALDNRTQAEISRSLENIPATRIVIAHRLSTVMGADRILVLQDGELAEEGTYRDLLDRGGLFAELVRRQTV